MPGTQYENLNDRFGRMYYKAYDDGERIAENVTVIADSRPSLKNPNGEGEIDFTFTDPSDGRLTQKTIPASAFLGFDELPNP